MILVVLLKVSELVLGHLDRETSELVLVHLLIEVVVL
jgi:hypothetical protein